MEGLSEIELRRELRKQKILQNAQNRLQKIKGEVKASNFENAEAVTTTTIYEPESEAIVNEEIPEWQSSETDNTPELKLDFMEKIFNSRAHIFILAITVRLLLFFNLGFLFSNMVLLPLLISEITEFLLVTENRFGCKNAGGILGAAMILSGLAESKTQGFLKTACVFKNICTDLAFYLFTFFVTHVVLRVLIWK